MGRPKKKCLIHYQDIRKHNYKYRLSRPYQCDIGMVTGRRRAVDGDYVVLEDNGWISFRAHYAWDGPSGPTIDTRNFMRGSLVHDGLYQLMREGKLDPRYRKDADELLRKMCMEDGMTRARARIVYWGVHWGGKRFAQPRPKPKVYCSP